jgi:hypothetical protein
MSSWPTLALGLADGLRVAVEQVAGLKITRASLNWKASFKLEREACAHKHATTLERLRENVTKYELTMVIGYLKSKQKLTAL